MKGILYSNYFIIAYLATITIYCILYLFFIPRAKTDNDAYIQKDIDTPGKVKARGLIHAMIILGVILSAITLTIKYHLVPVIYIFAVYAVLMWIIILPYSIYVFFNYIIIKPYDYELTETRKSTLSLLGFVMFYLCVIIGRNDFNSQIIQMSKSLDTALTDFIIMALLTVWYFTVLFFISFFLILSLHEIVILFISRMGDKPRNNAILKHEPSEYKVIVLSNHILARIEILPKGMVWKQIYYNTIWFLFVIVDVIIGFVYLMIKNSVTVIKVLLKAVQNGYEFVTKALSKNQGKSIILISRASIIGSLIIVFFIDKYQHIFSLAGSEIYEFLCSVIIIPLAIAQLIELYNRDKEAVELRQIK